MDFAEYPLLNTPHLILVLLKTASRREASLDDAVARLQEALGAAHERPAVETGEMRRRLDAIRHYLVEAGLLEAAAGDRFRATGQGLRALAEHPLGFDTADLMAYARFRRFIRRSRPAGARMDPHARQFDEGFAAYRDSRPFTDNPYAPDTLDHLVWEDGWFEALDEDESAG